MQYKSAEQKNDFQAYKLMRGMGLSPLQIAGLKKGAEVLQKDGYDQGAIKQMLSEGQILQSEGQLYLNLSSFKDRVKYSTEHPIHRSGAVAQDDIGAKVINLADHQTQTTSKARQYRLGGLGRAAAAGIAATILLYAGAKAEASPIWSLNNDTASTPFVILFDEWEGTPLEAYVGTSVREFQRQIENISTEGEELRKYIGPVGSNVGQIIHAWKEGDVNNNDWALTLNVNDFELTANSGHYLGVDETIIFKFLTTDLVASDDSTGTATGVSHPDDESFPGLTVNKPAIPEPGTLSLLALGLVGMLLRKRKR